MNYSERFDFSAAFSFAEAKYWRSDPINELRVGNAIVPIKADIDHLIAPLNEKEDQYIDPMDEI